MKLSQERSLLLFPSFLPTSPPPHPSLPSNQAANAPHGYKWWWWKPPTTILPLSATAAAFPQKNPPPPLHHHHRPGKKAAEVDEEDDEEVIERCIGVGISGRKRSEKVKHLSELSSWGIGGPCRCFLEATRPSLLISAVRYCGAQSIPFMVVGKGSNCLFDDRGFDGCVILNRLDSLETAPGWSYRVGSGYPFNVLGVRCSNEGLAGLEFAGGVPGTVGGAAFMNAGANGQETADVVERVEIVTTGGEIRLLERCELEFGYRKSCFQEMEDLAAILAVTFRLTPSASARSRQRDYLERRRRSQPVGERSAGSVFRNPKDSDMSAGELIEKAGLKGFELGGAKVSQVHANFFINFDRSTSRDMLELINFVKEMVDREFGVKLQEEIRYVPYNVM